MSLGRMLLFGAANGGGSQNQGIGRRADPPQAHDGTTAAADDNPGNGPEVILLFPALGFPALVRSRLLRNRSLRIRLLYCLLLTRKELPADAGPLLNGLLKYQEWSKLKSTDPAPGDLKSFGAGSFKIGKTVTVTDVIKKGGMISLPGIKGRGRLSEEVLKTYKGVGYRHLVSCTINLKASSVKVSKEDDIHLYNIVINGEKKMLHSLIKKIPLPHDDCPRDANREIKTTGDIEVRPLHPFCLYETDYLDVAHLTDLHVAQRWELMKKRIDSKHSGLKEHFNNLNQRLIDHLEKMKGDSEGKKVHMAILTGDLVDYNRGHDGSDANDLYKNYRFNGNWTLLYEILTENCHCPFFTVMGNHDWHLNPYAPVAQYIASFWRQQPNPWLVIIPFLTAAGTCTGVFTGLTYAAFNKDGVGWIFGGIGFVLLALVATPTLLNWLLDILEYFSGGKSLELGKHWGVGLFYLITTTLNIAGTAGILSRKLKDHKGDIGKGVKQGALWGSVLGGSWGVFVMLVGSILLEIYKLKDLPIYVMLKEDEVEKVIKENFHDSKIWGNNSNLRTTELAFRWYSLVINPFMDYYFSFGNMSFILLDWNRGESILKSSPPAASEALSQEQWNLVQQWKNTVSSETAAVLGMHATILASDVDANGLKKLYDSGEKWYSGDLDRATIDHYRSRLIELLRDLKKENKAASVLTLSGHTHANDVFKFIGKQKVRKLDININDIKASVLGIKEPCFITTTCADPLGDKKGRTNDLRRPSRREIKFDDKGQVIELAVKRLREKYEIRPEVLEY